MWPRAAPGARGWSGTTWCARALGSGAQPGLDPCAVPDLPHGQDHVPGALGQTGLLAVGWKGASRAVKVSWKRAGAYALTADNSVLADPRTAWN